MGQQGLAFLGIAAGVIIAITITVLMVNKAYVKASQKSGTPAPEERLPPAFYAGIACVIGLAGFAATCGPNVHYIASILFGVSHPTNPQFSPSYALISSTPFTHPGRSRSASAW